MSEITTQPTRILLATPHSRHDRLETRLRDRGLDVVRVRTPEELTPERLGVLAPTYVFFPHWSHLIPDSVFGEYECVIFHMTDLPFGRGGSPLQNLIVRGIYETQLSAIRCVGELDAGPIYSQMPLSLYGSAEEILLRAADLTECLILDIVERRPIPRPQIGEPTLFRRRGPQDGDVAGLTRLPQLHDHIRMLDAEGYPPAFLRVGRLMFEFSRSQLSDDHLLADVRVTLVPDEETP